MSSTRACPACARDVATSALICLYCQHVLAERIACSGCTRLVAASAPRCMYCGRDPRAPAAPASTSQAPLPSRSPVAPAAFTHNDGSWAILVVHLVWLGLDVGATIVLGNLLTYRAALWFGGLLALGWSVVMAGHAVFFERTVDDNAALGQRVPVAGWLAIGSGIALTVVAAWYAWRCGLAHALDGGRYNAQRIGLIALAAGAAALFAARATIELVRVGSRRWSA